MTLTWLPMPKMYFGEDKTCPISNYAIVGNKPYYYATLGETQCCGAQVLIGPQYFHVKDFLQIVKSINRTIYLVNGFNDQSNYKGDTLYDIEAALQLIKKQLKDVAIFHTHRVSKYETLIMIEILNVDKYLAWKAE